MGSSVALNTTYVILGATGNTGSIITNFLLSKGEKVRVVRRDPGRLQKLNAISGFNVLHLRPAYFMENNLAAIGMIQGTGIFGHALRADLKLPMIATRDTGDYAAKRLLDLDFSGKQTHELLGEHELSMAEATAVIGRGIGKPDLRYQQLPYDQVQQSLEQTGFSSKKAAVYIEMFKAINTGLLAPLEPRSPGNSTPTSFEIFVQDVFAPAYHGKASAA